MSEMKLPTSKLTRHQKKTFTTKNEDGTHIEVVLRHDNNCRNGKNSFSITGQYWEHGPRTRGSDICGCIHDLIEQYVPKYAKYIKWHLCSANGPMHYIANTVYHAGDRDCQGFREGDVTECRRGIQFNGSVVSHVISKELYYFIKEELQADSPFFEPEAIHSTLTTSNLKPNYSLKGFNATLHTAAFKTMAEARDFCDGLNNEPIKFVHIPFRFSEGKDRDLDAARRSAIWPEATDEQLSLPSDQLTQLLDARLPSLMNEFKEAMEELGFDY